MSDMILIFSDFGVIGPYSGAMRAVVHRNAPDITVCDLMVDAPDRNPRASAYLLAALSREFQPGDVVLCVVDPGVGSQRRGIVVECDGVFYVGPDNGLFEILIRRSKTCRVRVINWHPENASASFHGRDIFAPVACMIAKGEPVALGDIDVGLRYVPPQSWPDELSEIIYIDSYGNLMTGLLAAPGWQNRNLKLLINGQSLSPARTFSDVALGQGFHYRNSIGLCEVAVNCGRADQAFGAEIGTAVFIKPQN
ncbi:hypothetical protein SMB34_12365 [Thalassospira permensis NBRC 106175]|jgi:S-adenosylmethionine hydrolase|uniref:SAM-dependent chlorinase/fluorinase n=2 Tax=Thalassospiraceae TaxID=2844866 RepID=A0ABR4TUS7_9PROT|nr:hypothetical protein SMB34_12365 [Thalassospira permensis NBRC 106175]